MEKFSLEASWMDNEFCIGTIPVVTDYYVLITTFTDLLYT